MPGFRGLTVQSGVLTQIQDTNFLYVGNGIERAATAVAAKMSVGTTAQTNAMDIATNAAMTTLNIGTGMTLPAQVINIGGGGAAGSKTNILGDLTVSGNEVVIGTTTFEDNVVIGDGTGVDTLAFYDVGGATGGRLGSATYPDVYWVAGMDHLFAIAAPTVLNAAGNNLTVRGSVGNGTGAGGNGILLGGQAPGAGAGGQAQVKGGASVGGLGGGVLIDGGAGTTNGAVSVGTVAASAVTIGRSAGMTSPVTLNSTTSQGVVVAQNGSTLFDVGNTTNGKVTVSAELDFTNHIIGTNTVNHVISIAAQTAGNVSGKNLDVSAGDGFGSGAGGQVTISGGTAGATGNGGPVQIYGGSSGATSGNGGLVTIHGGIATFAGNGGGVSIIGANGGGDGGNHNGGTITIDGGAGTGTGLHGTVEIGSASTITNVTGRLNQSGGIAAITPTGNSSFNVAGGTLTLDSTGQLNVGATNATAIQIGHGAIQTTITGKLSQSGGNFALLGSTLPSTIQTAAAAANLNGTYILVQPGPGGASSGGGIPGGNGGELRLYGDAGGLAANVAADTGMGGDGGAISITAGVGGAAAAGTSAGGYGGTVALTGGIGGAASNTGAGQTGGDATFRAGAGGAGTAAQTSGAGGGIAISGGNAGAAAGGGGGNGGTVSIDAGSANGVPLALDGDINIGTGVAHAIYLGVGAATTITQVLSDAILFNGSTSVGVSVNGTSLLQATGTSLTVQTGALLTTTGTGNINLPNHGGGTPARFQIEGVSVGSTVTAANLDTLTNGGDASSPTVLHTHSGLAASTITISIVAGENIAAGQPLVLANNGGAANAYLGKANQVIDNVMGIALNSPTTGNPTTILVAGPAPVVDAYWDAAPGVADVGKRVYLSETSGKLTLTAPTTAGSSVMRVGIVQSAPGAGTTTVLFQPGEPMAIN